MLGSRALLCALALLVAGAATPAAAAAVAAANGTSPDGSTNSTAPVAPPPGTNGTTNGTASNSTALPVTPPPYAVVGMPWWRGYDWRWSGYRDGAAIPEARGQVFNVLDFNATGDGEADDSAALEDAIAAANDEEKGGIVYLPAGTYKLTRPLTISRSNVVLRGDGPWKTIIDIPVALEDVFKRKWAVNSNGDMTSTWSAGGGFITFQGKRQSSTNTKTLLAKVRGFYPGAQRTVPVDSTRKFEVGQRVRVFINDKTTKYTRRRLQQAAADPRRTAPSWAVRPGIARLGGTTVITQAAPAWVQVHPVYQAAMQGVALMGPEQGEWYTPQQAAAIDKAMAKDRGLEVGSAAANFTIVAWLYGQNNVDSGRGNDIIDRDELSVSAIVTEVGNDTITLDRVLPFPVYGSVWEGRIHSEVPTIEDAGVERLAVRFNHTLAAKHFAERGYNAFAINRVMNFWMRQVLILNADSGIFFSFVDRSTITDVLVGTTQSRVNPRWKDALNGHHAISLGEGHANVLKRFNITAPFIHDVTIASGTALNVVMDGGGANLNLDHHRTAPWANLFTNIDAGAGTRVFKSGGHSTKGAYSGRGNLYWNVYRSDGRAVALPKCGFGPLLSYFGNYSGSKCPANFWLVSPLPRGATPNYYTAQLAAAREFWRARARKQARAPRAVPRAALTRE